MQRPVCPPEEEVSKKYAKKQKHFTQLEEVSGSDSPRNDGEKKQQQQQQRGGQTAAT